MKNLNYTKLLRVPKLISLVLLIFWSCNQKQTIVFPEEEWEITSSERQGVDGYKMMEALQVLNGYCHEDGLEEVMVIRNGKVIYYGDGINCVHNIWSCRKSITSTILSLLIEEGKCHLNDKASIFEPRLS